MWWALIKSSALVIFLACNNKSSSSLNLYLAGSLLPLKDALLKASSNPLNLNFQSSSVIAQQIVAGAPCDAAIVADEAFKEYLIKKEAVLDQGRIVAYNALIVASQKKPASFKNAAEFFTELGERKLIIADPAFVPLGSYSKEALINLGVYRRLQKNLVMAHSAQNAAMLLNSGIAPYAILYASDVSENIHRVLAIDLKLHKPIVYPFLRCKIANKDKAEAIYALFNSPVVQQALKDKGFRLQL
ncbi:MAG TPA: molybdate ABC transporter substrate-binding protein [Myxococcota bacterium]|nr:molybdate ABC transporter substrate-binding protein [Myxococcota bacterium]